MIPILQFNDPKSDTKLKVFDPLNTTMIGNLSQPDTKENGDREITSNTANVVHNFESIEVGVVVGVAIGVFIVLICFGSVMLCFRCGQRRDRRKESNLVTNTG